MAERIAGVVNLLFSEGSRGPIKRANLDKIDLVTCLLPPSVRASA